MERGAVRHDSVRAAEWSIRGAAKVLGDVDVTRFTSSGDVSVGGRLRADRWDARGDLRLFGPVEVGGPWTGSGEVRAGATVHAGDLTFKGSVRIAQELTVDGTADLVGSLEVPSARVGVLRLTGAAQVPGEVASIQIALRLRETSRLGTLRGRRVEVRGRAPNPVEEALLKHVAVTVERIDAEEVVLEAVDVGFVHAERISLGRGAHVTTVEGTVVARHASATVGPESKSPPPYGLRR